MQSVISPVIAQEIAENKDKMIDALYPIMGGMISKYVTNAIKEMMEHINAKIEEGLSFERYKRKLKAKMTGVSETEILLEESLDATIRSLFIIQKETGLLVAEVHLENREINDPHMVASMASAIKDFVNDWTEKAEETSEVQLLSYGNATLYIESAGSVYLIAFLDTEPDFEQRSKINVFFAKIIKKYSRFFQDFDGDDSAPEIQTIEEMMRKFLRETKPPVPRENAAKKNPLKYILILFLLLCFAYAAYWGKGKYELYLLEQQISRQTGAHITIEKENHTLYLKGYLASIKDFYTIKKLIKEKTGKDFVNEMYLPPEEMDQKLMQQKKTMAQTVKRLSLETNRALKDQQHTVKVLENTLTSKYDRLEQKVAGLEAELQTINTRYHTTRKKLDTAISISVMKAHALEKLKEAFSHTDAFHPKDGSLDFKNKHLFEAGQSVPKADSLSVLKQGFKKYITVLMGDKQIKPYIKGFVIEGYTDSSGSYDFNKALSLERAKQIKKYVLTLPVSKQYHLSKIIDARGMADENPVIINGVEDREASRRIKIRFVFNSDKAIESIEKALND
ncbi:OmpA family protein [Sulfurovum sp.]|uniref:OmpA family protein n=1 Tax=Sulfurovum sp. TaxID=1969726 RepID=UPI0025ECE347|nr:OmpA family protein [Sulfurovum sp.]